MEALLTMEGDTALGSNNVPPTPASYWTPGTVIFNRAEDKDKSKDKGYIHTEGT